MIWRHAPKIVPPMCLAAGVMAAVLAMAATSRHAPQTAEALRKYAELPAGEVRRLKATWHALSSAPNDQAAIRSIHEAIREDPLLDEQLALFYAWWVAANPEQRAELHGTPDDEWADRVRQLMADSREPEGLEISFQGLRRPGTGNRSFDAQVSDEQLQAFFQSALPDDHLSAEEQAILSGIGEEDRFLTRALILAERLTPESFRRDSPPESARAGSGVQCDHHTPVSEHAKPP